ncbi:MAG: PP2C family protein-serine/threonine phosphatase [Anaerolineae bacterium]
MGDLNTMELNQMLDAGQVERFLQSLAEIVPVTLRVEDLDGQVLAEVMPASVTAEQGSAGEEETRRQGDKETREQGDRHPVSPSPPHLVTPAPPHLRASAQREVRAPIEIHDEQSGYVVGLALHAGGPAAQVIEAVTHLAAQVLAEQVYREHELNSLSTELLDKYEEVTLLYDLSQALGSVFDIPTICEIALEKAVQAVPAAKAFIMLKDETSEFLTVVAARVDGLIGWTTPVGHGVSGRVAASGKPILLLEGEELPAGMPEDQAPRDAVLAVPLTLAGGQSDEQVLGVMTLAGKAHGKMFTAGDAKLLTTIATQIAIGIHNSRLVEAQREAERVRQEMEIAAQIQQSLLPEGAPQLMGATVAGYCSPAANVGGDYYDVLTDDAGRLTLLIADVSGHSIGSALMMAMARSILRREIAQGESPAAVLAATNTAMLQDLTNAGLFITMFCARYDPATRCFTFANGGHNPPLLRRAADGQFVALDGDGLIVGILDDVVYEEQSITLQPGDVVVHYTDGIVEARNLEGEQFGEDRLQELLAENGDLGPGAMADRIYEAVREHSRDIAQQDDITLLILKVDGTVDSNQ